MAEKKKPIDQYMTSNMLSCDALLQVLQALRRLAHEVLLLVGVDVHALQKRGPKLCGGILVDALGDEQARQARGGGR